MTTTHFGERMRLVSGCVCPLCTWTKPLTMAYRDWDQHDQRGTVRRRDEHEDNWDYKKRRRYDVSTPCHAAGVKNLADLHIFRTMTTTKIVTTETTIVRMIDMTMGIIIIMTVAIRELTMTGGHATIPWKMILTTNSINKNTTTRENEW
jgi:hypothetical protein